MSTTVTTRVGQLRTLPKDIGVTLVVLAALALGLVLRFTTETNHTPFSSSDRGFSMAYPATWRTGEVTGTLLLHVEDAESRSAYKSNVTVESRELDPAAPPTLQELVDRRVVQHGTLLGYHFLSNKERTVAGAKSSEVEYAFVSQPIDTPRSASLPVVTRSREYIVVAKNRVYFITLSASESDFQRASTQFDAMLQTVKIQ